MKKYIAFLIIILFLPLVANASIAFVDSTATEITAAGTAVSSTINITSGNLIVGFCGNNSSASTSSISDTIGNTFVIATNTPNGNAAHHLTAWYASSTGSNASDVITCTFNVSAADRDIHVIQYSGAAGSPVDIVTATTSVTASFVTSKPFSTTNSGDVVVSSGKNNTSGSGVQFTVGTSSPVSTLRATSTFMGTEDWFPGVTLTNATTALAKVGNTAQWTFITVAFLPAPAGGAGASSALSNSLASLTGILNVSNATLKVANAKLNVQ